MARRDPIATNLPTAALPANGSVGRIHLDKPVPLKREVCLQVIVLPALGSAPIFIAAVSAASQDVFCWEILVLFELTL